jgi:hypothetical protein
MVFRSHPIGACCMRSGRLYGFIPQTLAHFEEHILTLHTARVQRCHATCSESLHFVGLAISACLLPSSPRPTCTADSSAALTATAPGRS